MQKAGLDFTISGSTIQFGAAAVPQPGDTLLASYREAGSSDSTGSVYPSPQVLCEGAGATTAATTLGSVGMCTIPSGTLAPGDRLEIHFDFEHAGTASGFSFEIHWGATTVLHRDAAASDVLATGRVEAGLKSSGADVSTQSWGTVLPGRTD